MTEADRQTVNLAFGRIFRLMSRPEQSGDAADYERCRAVILDVLDPPPFIDRAPDYGRDRLKGAQGAWS